MPGPLDAVLVLLFAVGWPLWACFVSWPKTVRAVDRGEPGARVRAYVQTIAEEWAFAAGAVALAVAAGRPWSTLGLSGPSGWRLAAGLGLTLGWGGLLTLQYRSIAARPAVLWRVRRSIASLGALVPHTARDGRWFVPLAITAGVCEELLFRGYLVWVLEPWLGAWGAAGASLLVFGLAHAYQGRKKLPQVFVAGAVMTLVTLAAGSVLPAMLLHAWVDLAGGWLGYRAVHAPEPGPAAAPAAARAG